jgi:hypothetical protein
MSKKIDENKIEIKSFKLNGKEVDLKNSVPLTIGDIRALKKSGLDLLKVGTTETMDVEQICTLLLYVFKKANPEIDQADVDTLSLPAMNRISTVLTSQDDDLPF